jgi:hypothetical protein
VLQIEIIQAFPRKQCFSNSGFFTTAASGLTDDVRWSERAISAIHVTPQNLLERFMSSPILSFVVIAWDVSYPKNVTNFLSLGVSGRPLKAAKSA